MKQSKLYEIWWENYGLNGDMTEGNTLVTNVVAKDIEEAIRKFRSAQPKSLQYEIQEVTKQNGELIS